MKKEKKLYLEVMRIFAVLFVIFNHTGAQGFFLYRRYPIGTLKFWIFLFCSVFCKFAVPLFFAISGALLIPKFDEKISTLWQKRIIKMVCILLVFSFLYGVLSPSLGGVHYSLKDLIIAVYQEPIPKGAHLWYLYAYIAFLIALPFLRAMCKCLENKMFVYMICISIAIKSIPILEYLLFKQKYKLYGSALPSWLVSSIVLYPAVGYYMENRIEIRKVGKWLLPLWVVNFGTILLSGYVTMVRGLDMGGIEESISQTFYENYVLLNCMTIYLTLKYLCAKIQFSERMACLIQTVGECTFGIYLLHLIAMRLPIAVEIRDAILRLEIHPMIGIWIFIFGIASVCFAVTYLLKKIPGVKMLIGG